LRAPEVAPARLAELARATTPSAGATRVLAIDGRSGAGKSTLAQRLATEMQVPCVSLEQLYGGWDGLQAGVDRLVEDVLAPLAAGREAAVPLYDWVAARWLAPQVLQPPPLLIVEGVGAGALAAAPHVGLLAWLELSEAARRERAMDRDGSLYGGHWDMWRAQEDVYLEVNRTAERADVVIAGES
jgi:uridine kinase